MILDLFWKLIWKYPNHLHADHASLPLLPDHCEFTFDNLSPFSQAGLRLLRGERQAKISSSEARYKCER